MSADSWHGRAFVVLYRPVVRGHMWIAGRRQAAAGRSTWPLWVLAWAPFYTLHAWFKDLAEMIYGA